MTLKAERRLGVCEKIIVVSAMRQVTGFAPIGLQNFMYYLLVIICRLMALRADCVPLFLEQGASLGSMGVVATDAGRFLYGRVHFCLVQTYFFPGMARIAEIITRPLEEQLGNSAMPEMTFVAFFFFDHAMDVFHAEILVSEFFVALKAIFLFKSLLGKY